MMWVLVLLLFTFFAVACYSLLQLFSDHSSFRRRLSYRKYKHLKTSQNKLWDHAQWISRLSVMLETIRWPMGTLTFLILSWTMFLVGALVGVFLLGNFSAIVMLGCVAGLLPYLVLRMRLLSMQMQHRLEFLPAVEVFYQVYVLHEHKNLRIVLQDMLARGSLNRSIHSVFDQLNRNLTTQRDERISLDVFKLTLGHRWAAYFAGMLETGLREGVDLTASLRELIKDMRRARLSDQIERNRLLEIRIANFSPLLFLVIFLMINFWIQYEQSYRYYFVVPEGRMLLAEALFLIFLSFLMGVWLSVKRI